MAPGERGITTEMSRPPSGWLRAMTVARWAVTTDRAMEVLGGRGTRLALLIGSLLAGLLIALLTVHLAGQWQSGF